MLSLSFVLCFSLPTASICVQHWREGARKVGLVEGFLNVFQGGLGVYSIKLTQRGPGSSD